MIKGMDYNGDECVLTYKSGATAQKGDVVNLHNGGIGTLLGGHAPRSMNSSGRVYVRETGRTTDSEYYPSIIDAEWKVT